MTILILDKVPVYRHGMVLFLKSTFPDVTIIESEIIDSFRCDQIEESLDLIVASVNRDFGSSGSDDIFKIRKWYPAARVVVFENNPEYEQVIDHLNAGVSGYFSAEEDLDEFARCIKEVLEGKRYISQEILWTLLDLRETSVAKETGTAAPLTAHEYRIAKYLSEGKKTTWIAAKLCRKASTVSTIKSNIFKKLNINNVFELRLRLEEEAGMQGRLAAVSVLDR